MAIRNLLLDRDGTLIVDKHYLCDPDGVELIPGAAGALAGLVARDVRLFVVTNQSVIGRGMCTPAQVDATNARVARLCEAAGAPLTDTVYCPHTPEAGCTCRKPAPGLWEELRRRHGLDPAETAMAGDKPADIGFAGAAGLAAAILVETGKGRESARELGLPPLQGEWAEPSGGGRQGLPHCHAIDVAAACRWLLGRVPEPAP